MHIFKNGPAIKVYCLVKELTLREVKIELNERKEFQWTCHGDGTSKTLEKDLARWFKAYCEGRESEIVLPLPLDSLPPFTLEVIKKISAIPFGEVVTYQEIAEQLDHPLASRAVGNACGRNPIPLIIPCHRVVPKNRQIGGYSAGGKEIKKCLLSFEKSLNN